MLNPFPESNLLSDNQRLLFKTKEKNPCNRKKIATKSYHLGKIAGLCPAIFGGTTENLEK